jgi:SAM-dependent methyltransferase
VSSALYDGFIADYYDAAPMVAGRPHDVAFYCYAAREFGEPVLELRCGTGRVTMALAERRYRVTGLDLSKPMLERAEEKRAKLPAEERALVHLLQGDMTRFDLREKFSLVIIPFRPFQHLLEQTSKFLVSTLCAGTLPRKAVDSGNGAAAHPGCFPDRRAKHARPDVSRGESGRRIPDA